MSGHDAYAGIDAVNWSTLKYILESPAKYQHVLRHPRRDTPALRFGRAVHCAALEPARFAVEYSVYAGDRRTTEWHAFRAAHPGCDIMDRDDYDAVTRIAAAVRSHPVASRYLVGAEVEHTLTWVDGRTGVALKGRLDALTLTPRAVADLKTTRDISARAVAGDCARYLYHGQLGLYTRAAEAQYGGEFSAVIVAAEKEPPYEVGVFRLSETALFEGRRLADKALDLLVACRESGQWPGRYPDEQELDLPAWATADEGDDAGEKWLMGGAA